MSVLAGVTAERVHRRAVERGPLSWLIDVDFRVPAWEDLVAEVRQAAQDEVWDWYREQQAEVVLRVRVLLWSKEVRLRDLRHLVEAIAGPEPKP